MRLYRDRTNTSPLRRGTIACMRTWLRAALVLTLFATPAFADPSAPPPKSDKPPADTAKPKPNDGSDAKPPQSGSDTTPTKDKPAKCKRGNCPPPK